MGVMLGGVPNPEPREARRFLIAEKIHAFVCGSSHVDQRSARDDSSAVANAVMELFPDVGVEDWLIATVPTPSGTCRGDTPMTTTKTTLAGTVQIRYFCWELARENGSPVEGHEVVPHFQSEEEAKRFAPEYASAAGKLPVPKQLNTACYLARARCGYTLDQENTAEMHHASAEEAYRCAIDSEFKDMGDGTLRCSPDCDECVEVS